MINNFSQILKSAQTQKYAVGGFNTINLETTQAIIAAAEAKKSPVIVQISEKTIEYAEMEEIYTIVKFLAEKATVPVVIHLDHGKSLITAIKCIGIGFSSVMIDGSRLPYEENIAITKSVVDLAHPKGISVEGELGAVGKQSEDSHIVETMMTDPDQAADFVTKTGIDALAIGCGTSHGTPIPDERIHFDVIQSIAQKVSIPLVLHGSSNIDSENIKKAISLGICKINIDTEIRQSFTTGAKQFLADNPDKFDPRDFLAFARSKAQAKIESKIDVFGSQNKA